MLPPSAPTPLCASQVGRRLRRAKLAALAVLDALLGTRWTPAAAAAPAAAGTASAGADVLGNAQDEAGQLKPRLYGGVEEEALEGKPGARVEALPHPRDGDGQRPQALTQARRRLKAKRRS